MQSKLFIALSLAAALAGCAAAPVQDSTRVEGTSEALTVQECATQQSSCFGANSIFGFFTCPVQYAQCLATASNGLPAQVTSAINDANACARQDVSCHMEATSPAENLGCTEQTADCVAKIVGARLPTVVTGTAQCVTSSVDCIRAAKTANDIAACGETLQSCAVGQAVAVLPPAVGTAVQNVDTCLGTLRTCTEAATTPAALTQCSQDEVHCVGNALNVPVPNIPVAQAVKCAENAAQCTLDASSVAALQDCNLSLISCNGTIANQVLTCDQKFTRCLSQNPFAFLQCALDFSNCQ